MFLTPKHHTMTELINAEDLKDLSPEEIAEKIDQANEAYKKLQSDTERWAQQLLEEKKLAEQSLKAIWEINGDNAKFVELYEKDKKLGDYLLKTVFNWASIDDFKVGGTASAKPTKEAFDELYEQRRIDEMKEEILSKLSPEDREKVEKEFNDITEWKKLTKDSLNKYIKMALKEVAPDYSKEEMEARVNSLWGSIAKPRTETWPKTDSYTSSFLEQMGVVKKATK